VKEAAKLYFMCEKTAAGKSTHARNLAQAKNAVLFVQDRCGLIEVGRRIS
jgi:hypothetical protein